MYSKIPKNNAAIHNTNVTRNIFFFLTQFLVDDCKRQHATMNIAKTSAVAPRKA
jgi:hypothetical protein